MNRSYEHVTLGTKVFSRTAKLVQLLNSVRDPIDKVIIANDGNADLSGITSEAWPFELSIIDLPFDAGLGAGRRAIVDELTDDYLLIVDTDHEVPENIHALLDVLIADPTLGGVAGLVDEGDGPGGLCHDLDKHEDVLLRTIRGEKQVQEVGGRSFVLFDFIPNAALFRADALESYNWDAEYVIGREHLDFYVGHWQRTPWNFGVCPDVVFPHHPGGSTGYRLNRHNAEKLANSEGYFCDKWGYRTVLHLEDWLNHGQGDKALHPLPTPPGLPIDVQAHLKCTKHRLGRVLR